jgi:predicted dehydrogenase
MFLKSSAAAAVATPYIFRTPSAFASGSPSDRPGIGCVGMGTRGNVDARAHAAFGDIVAVCDVDANRREAARNHKKIGRGKAVGHGDYRRLLERKDIDVVCVATTDLWHAKIAIEALQAGKHVFCQKPLTLTLEENLLVRNACWKYKDRVFGVGTQQRSDQQRFLRAVNMVQKGLLGDIKTITIGINGGLRGGPFEKAAPPPGLDWNAWLGQVPKVDYIRQRCHGTFRWWYEYSGGKFTDWGAHHVDIATWAIGQDRQAAGPTEIDGTDAHHAVPLKDGYPTIDDCYNTADDFAVKCKFPSGILMTVTNRTDNGILFEGTKGRIFVSRNKITGKPIDESWDRGKFEQADLDRLYKGKPCEAHVANFYRTIHEGGLPVSDVFSHVQTMNTCHLCAIAARLGRVIRWDPHAEKITGDEQAAAFFARQPRKGFEIPRV